MNTTAPSTVRTVRDLLTAPGPCITIALAGNAAGDFGTELKNAINAVRDSVRGRSLDVESLIAPITDAGTEFRGAAKFRGAMVILASPAVIEVYRLPSVLPLVRVADWFDIRTVLTARSAQRTFYVLALSQKRTRILKCGLENWEEIPFPEGFPASLADSAQTRKPDHNLNNRSAAGSAMGAAGGVMFGTSSDADDRDEYRLHFFAEVDRAVKSVLKDSTDPLVLFGVEHEMALYRRVNTFPHLLDRGVHGAPDGLEGAEVHHRAFELLEQKEQEPGHSVPADFDKQVGTGHASTHIHDIVAAAYEGRVSQFFFQSNAEYLGTYDPVRHRVKRTDDPLDSPVDLIETAALQTVVQGGEAKIVPGAAMPAGVPVCALFRYPAKQIAGASQRRGR